MVEVHNNLSRLKAYRHASIIYGVYATDGRIADIAYRIVQSKFKISAASRVTLDIKNIRDVHGYSSILPFNDPFWLITINDADQLTKVQFKMLAQAQHCVFILNTTHYKGYLALEEALTELPVHTMLLNLGYMNPYLVFNLVDYYELQDVISENLRRRIGYRYGSQSKDVVDMFLRLRVDRGKLTQKRLIEYLGYPVNSIRDVAIQILNFRKELLVDGNPTKIRVKNRARKIHAPGTAYAKKYSYRSLQDQLGKLFEAMIEVKTAYIKGTQRLIKVRVEEPKSDYDKLLRFAYGIYNDQLSNKSLAYITTCYIDLKKTRWLNETDFLEYIQALTSEVEEYTNREENKN